MTRRIHPGQAAFILKQAVDEFQAERRIPQRIKSAANIIIDGYADTPDMEKMAYLAQLGRLLQRLGHRVGKGKVPGSQVAAKASPEAMQSALAERAAMPQPPGLRGGVGSALERAGGSAERGGQQFHQFLSGGNADKIKSLREGTSRLSVEKEVARLRSEGMSPGMAWSEVNRLSKVPGASPNMASGIKDQMALDTLNKQIMGGAAGTAAMGYAGAKALGGVFGGGPGSGVPMIDPRTSEVVYVDPSAIRRG